MALDLDLWVAFHRERAAMAMEVEKRKVILLVGGSGYLGLHVLEALASSDYTLAYTYNSHPSPAAQLPNVLAFHLNLRNGDGLDAMAKALGTVSLLETYVAMISTDRSCVEAE